MKRKVLVILGAAWLCSVGAHAATFEVPLSGKYTLSAFDPTSDSPCPDNYCVTTLDLRGTFMLVKTPDGDGSFTDGVSVSYRFMPDWPAQDYAFDLWGFSSASHGGDGGYQDDEATVVGGKLVGLQVSGDDEGEELGIVANSSGGKFDWWATAGHTQAWASGALLLSPIPEPSSLSLLAVGALGLMLGRTTRRSPSAR